MSKKLIYGVGINDANYVISPTTEGKRVKCHLYSTWHRMLERCYSLKYKEKNPTYEDCIADTEWHSFMTFRSWMEKQDYENKQLDKDLLFTGNKIYSKNTCVFISKALNTFLCEKVTSAGTLPTGVSMDWNKFHASCSNPFTKRREYLGSYDTAEEANLAWKAHKHELALRYAGMETDERVVLALKTRFL